MSFDRRAIMHEAWEIVRRFVSRGDARSVRELLSHALKGAWYNARVKAHLACREVVVLGEQAALEARSVASLNAEAITLENRTFLSHEGMCRLSAVQNAMRVARDREAQSLPIAA